MSFRNVSVKFSADTSGYVAGTRAAAAATESLADKAKESSRSIADDARANIAASVARRQKLSALATEYRSVAAASAKGSAEQVAAEKLAASTAKRLGEVGTESRKAQSALSVFRQGFTELGNTGLAQTSGLAAGVSGLTRTFSAARIGAVGAVAGIGVGLAKMTADGVSKFQELGSEVRKLQGTLGSSAEEASGFRNVAASLGIDTDTLAKGINRLSINLDKTKGDLAGIHVETVRNADGNVDMAKTFDNVRNAYQSIQDPQQRNIFLQDAMSKGGAELRSVMALTNDEFAKRAASGPILNQDDVNRSKELATAQRELSESFASLEINLARGIVPVLTALSNGLGLVIDGADELHLPIVQIGAAAIAAAAGVKLLSAAFATEASTAAAAAAANTAAATSEIAAGAGGGGIGTVGKAGIGTLAARALPGAFSIWAGTELGKQGPTISKETMSDFQELESKIPVIGGWLADFDRHGPFTEHPEIKKNTADLIDQKGVMERAPQAWTEMFQQTETDAENTAAALLKLPGAQQSVADASRGVADAQRDLSELQSKGAVDARAVASAQEAVESSSHSLTSAQEQLGDAQKRLDDLLAKGPVDWKAVADAQDQVEHSSRTLVAARERLTDSERKLHDLLAQGPIDARKVADAQDRVKSTSRSLADAQDRLARAQKNLNDVMKGASSDDLAHGYLSLREATLGVAQAKQAEANAQERLVEAYKGGDPNAVADADLALKASKLGVQAAILRNSDAQKDLTDLEKKGKEGSEDLTDARKQLADAELGVADSVKAAKDARDELALAQAGDPEFADKVAEAERGVRDARYGVTDATTALQKARDDLATAQAGDPEFSDKVRDAERGVRDARYGVESATRAVIKARDDLAVAQAGDPEFQDKLAAAHRNVETAVRQEMQARVEQDILESTIANGSAPNNREQIRLTIGVWERLRDSLAPGSPLRAYAQQMVDFLNEQYKLHVDTTEAMENLRNLAERSIAIRQAALGTDKLSPEQANSVRNYVNRSGHAEGGFITSPELSWVGEGGRAEVILPLTDPRRTAELLGQAHRRYPAAFATDTYRPNSPASTSPFSPMWSQPYTPCTGGTMGHSSNQSGGRVVHEHNWNMSIGDNPSDTANTIRREMEWLYATQR